MAKYLDNTGLTYFWNKLKTYFQEKLVSGTNIKTINNQSILGSGDIPVAGSDIYDMGSNTNGSWLRLTNGIMICWNHVEVTNQAINSLYTSGHYTGSRIMTYPQEFTSIPTVNCSMFRWGTSASWPMVGNVTLTNCSLYGIDTVSRASGTRTQISYSAIGFWK